MFWKLLLLFAVVIYVHELGHYLMLRWTGVTAKAFGIGVGPKWLTFRFTAWGTEWRIAPFLFIGYVLTPSDHPEMPFDETRGVGWLLMQAIRPFHAVVKFFISGAEGYDAPPESLYARSAFARFQVVFAGPAANLLLAFVVFTGAFYFYGSEVVGGMPEAATAEGPAHVEFLDDAQHNLLRSMSLSAIMTLTLIVISCVVSVSLLWELITFQVPLMGFIEGTSECSTLFAESGVFSWCQFLTLLAIGNVFVAVFNLFPIPGLDGCHLVVNSLGRLLSESRRRKLLGAMYLCGTVMIALILVWCIGRDVVYGVVQLLAIAT